MPQPAKTARRKTPAGVRRKEAVAAALVAVGGFGTILSIVLIFVFLLWVVLPLAAPASVSGPRALPQPLASDGLVAAGTDDLGLMCWTLDRTGLLRVVALEGGAELSTEGLFQGVTPSAWSVSPEGNSFAAGFPDGSIRGGTILVATRYPGDDEIPVPLRHLAPGHHAPMGGGMLTVTPQGQFRHERIEVQLGEAIAPAGDAITALDFLRRDDGTFSFATLDVRGAFRLHVESVTENWMTGESTRTLESSDVPLAAPPDSGPPMRLLLSSGRSSAYLIWRHGLCQRYDIRVGETPKLVEARAVDARGVPLTSAEFLIGRTTLVVGDEEGGLRAWFVTKPAHAETADGSILTPVREYPPGSAAVTCVGTSRRSRVMIAGYADGSAQLIQTTHAALLARMQPASSPLLAVALAPKEDRILAVARDRGTVYGLDLKHAEVTLGSLFGEVWYEGYEKPDHVWQTVGGSDEAEPKFGLWPLIFGTLKATVYSLLIAAPIALLAAVFTSEFMVTRWRTGVKSAVEMMASLPSVVLGFLAAMIVAPFVESRVPALLLCFATVPVFLLLGARLWQLLPPSWAPRLAGWPRFGAIAAFIPLGIAAARWLGPRMEAAWFGGDMHRWLDGRGDAFGGWMLILFPACALAVVLLGTVTLTPRVRAWSRSFDDRACALIDLARYALLLGGTVALTFAAARLCSAAGWDVRNGVMGSYAQRNALIVGCMMGFAIIPIIYTIAEDALSSVPRHLREASLGAGATPWQTAWRIVIPTAMSGLFGALMVGFGRAIGETMIVLMAAGNSPIRDWNMFEGFRTLSANIATEIMEAPQDGTHYRVLFLTALVLFGMTFVLNTGVEIMRRIFRRRFASL